MTIRYLIRLLNIDLGVDAFEEIARLYPQGRMGPAIDIDLPFDDPVMRQVLSTLARYGWQPHNPLLPPPEKSLLIDAYREYVPEDLTASEYLVMEPMGLVDAMDGSDGTLTLMPSSSQRNLLRKPIFTAWIRNIVVESSLRADMEVAGFEGLGFRPAALRNPRSGGGPRYWQLTPRVLMPPLGEQMLRLDHQMRPYTGNPLDAESFLDGAELPEALISTPELHYRRASVEALGPFDVASTHEKTFGGASRETVVSQRVYQFCV